MIQKFVQILVLPIILIGTTKVGFAQDMSESERKEVETVVREYILNHPEIIAEAIGVLQARQKAQQQEMITNAILANKDQILNDGFSVAGGNPNGDITIVEFFDYRCPYCVKGHSDMKKVLAEDNGIKIIYKQFPVKDKPNEDPISLTSARMAQAIAKQSKYLFEAFHNRLMQFNTHMTITDLGNAAREIGVDMARMQTDLQDPAIIDGIRSNFELASKLGVTGTPTYVIGDQVLVGAIGVENMQTAIKKAREEKTN